MTNALDLENRIGELARESASYYQQLLHPPLSRVAQSVLWRLTLKQGMSLTELAKDMDASISNIKKHVDELKGLGLLRSENGPRGSVILAISDTKITEVTDWKARVISEIYSVFDVLSAEERLILNDMLSRILLHLRDMATKTDSSPLTTALPTVHTAEHNSEERREKHNSSSTEQSMPSGFTAASLVGLKITVEAYAAASASSRERTPSGGAIITQVQAVEGSQSD